jgi:hypothetical protein
VKTKHPQLLYESKLYKILQGGGKALGTGLGTALLLTSVPAAAAAQRATAACLSPDFDSRPSWWCSGRPQRALVWRGGRLQRDGHRPAGAQLGGPLQLLQQKVQPQNSADAGGPVGAWSGAWGRGGRPRQQAAAHAQAQQLQPQSVASKVPPRARHTAGTAGHGRGTIRKRQACSGLLSRRVTGHGSSIC